MAAVPTTTRSVLWLLADNVVPGGGLCNVKITGAARRCRAASGHTQGRASDRTTSGGRLPLRPGLVRRHFDEIAVRVAKVCGRDRAQGAGARNRPLLDPDVALAQVVDDHLGRLAGDEAQSGRAGDRMARVRGPVERWVGHPDSLDHLVCAREQRLRHGYAERLRRLCVDHQLEPGWLLHRNVGRLGTLDDLVDEAGCGAPMPRVG